MKRARFATQFVALVLLLGFTMCQYTSLSDYVYEVLDPNAPRLEIVTPPQATSNCTVTGTCSSSSNSLDLAKNALAKSVSDFEKFVEAKRCACMGKQQDATILRSCITDYVFTPLKAFATGSCNACKNTMILLAEIAKKNSASTCNDAVKEVCSSVLTARNSAGVACRNIQSAVCSADATATTIALDYCKQRQLC